MLQLYKNIRTRRKELGMTQTDLAKKTGYTNKSSIASIEAGNVDLPQSKILEFAKALDVSPSTLMGWESDEEEFDDIIEITTSTSEEADLLECFRELSEMKKAEALRFLNYLLYQEGK